MIFEASIVEPDFSLQIDIPSRSTLFSLEPLGTNTPQQESLVSLLVRTSFAHAVSPRQLIRKVFPAADGAIARLSVAAFYQRLAGTMNGLGKYAELFVSAMEDLTGQANLRHLTMLPWRELFPRNGLGLLSRHPRWCPVCLYSNYQKGTPTVFPLIWALEPYQVCSIHLVSLEQRCPSCSKLQSVIPCHPDLGICGSCRQPLGCVRSPIEPSYFNSWVGEALGNMVARQSGSDFVASLDHFYGFVRASVTAYSGGNRAAFCRALGLNEFGLNGWLNKGERPSITQFLALCYGTKTMPADVFGEANHSPYVSALRMPPEKLKRRHVQPRPSPCQIALVKDALRGFLQSGEGLSVSAIAKKIGLGRGCLQYRFPELCQALSEQHQVVARSKSEAKRAQQCLLVGKVIGSLRAEGGSLSKRRVDALLRGEGLSLSQPHLVKAYKAALLQT